MQAPILVYEGTWDELRAHSSKFKGKRLRLTVLPPKEEKQLTLQDRRDFLALPMEERGRILEMQSERMVTYYSEHSDWRELQGGDIVEYTACKAEER